MEMTGFKLFCIVLQYLAQVSWMKVEASTIREKPCYKHTADITFLLDTSVSIHEEDFEKELDFVKQIIYPLPIGKFGVQVSVATYSSDVVTNIYFDDFYDKDDLLQAVGGIRYRMGLTNTFLAIAHARDFMFRKENGCREGAERVIIVVTDGYSTNNESTLTEAAKSKDLGIKMIAVGVGYGIDIDELTGIASTHNGEKMAFTADNFDDLKNVVDKVTMSTCDVMQQDTTKHDKQKTKDCTMTPADIYFAIDSSSSVIFNEDDQILSYLSKVVKSFDIGPDTTRIGMITYSQHVHQILRLDSTYDKTTIVEKLMNVPHYGSSTKTGSALHFLRRNGFKRNYSRTEVAHVVILVTDGQSTDHAKTLKEAELLKKLGVFIFVVGIGQRVDLDEVRQIASEPYEHFTLLKEDLETLTEVKNILPCKVFDTNRLSESTSRMHRDTALRATGCTSSIPTSTLFVYDELTFSTETRSILHKFLKSTMSFVTDSLVQHDWTINSRDEKSTNQHSQAENVAFLLKSARIHGYGDKALISDVVRRNLVVFVDMSTGENLMKLVQELRRFYFVYKSNIVLILMGDDEHHHDAYIQNLPENFQIIKIASLNNIDDVTSAMMNEIQNVCSSMITSR
ncbi:collagen [Mactra antiquata]